MCAKIFAPFWRTKLFCFMHYSFLHGLFRNSRNYRIHIPFIHYMQQFCQVTAFFRKRKVPKITRSLDPIILLYVDIGVIRMPPLVPFVLENNLRRFLLVFQNLNQSANIFGVDIQSQPIKHYVNSKSTPLAQMHSKSQQLFWRTLTTITVLS